MVLSISSDNAFRVICRKKHHLIERQGMVHVMRSPIITHFESGVISANTFKPPLLGAVASTKERAGCHSRCCRSPRQRLRPFRHQQSLNRVTASSTSVPSRSRYSVTIAVAFSDGRKSEKPVIGLLTTLGGDAGFCPTEAGGEEGPTSTLPSARSTVSVTSADDVAKMPDSSVNEWWSVTRPCLRTKFLFSRRYLHVASSRIRFRHPAYQSSNPAHRLYCFCTCNDTLRPNTIAASRL